MSADADRLFREAARAYARKRPGEALALALRVLDAAPTHTPANHLAAKLFLEAGDLAAADACCSAFVAADPSHLGGVILSAQIAYRSGNPRHAIRRFGAAAELAPDNPQPAFLRAVVLLEIGEFVEAVDALQALVLRHPAHAPAWGVLGQARRRAGDAAGAVAALDQALKLAPDFADAWFDLGLARQDLGDLLGATEAFARLPHRAAAQVNRGLALQELGRIDEAFAAYGRAYRLDASTFAPIAHALTSQPHGRLWLSLGRLAEDLAKAGGEAGSACDTRPVSPAPRARSS